MTLSSAAQSSFPGGLGSHYVSLTVIIYYFRHSKFDQLREKKYPPNIGGYFSLGQIRPLSAKDMTAVSATMK